MDEYAVEYDEPERETIKHRHPTLPFVEITQTRYRDAGPGDERFEDWAFLVRGPNGSVGYDGTSYTRGDSTEQEMLDSMAERAEKHLLNDRGPFFVLRCYLETGEYRKEIDAVMRKHGQSPLWRRVEAATARRLGVERQAIRMRYWLRGERPKF